MRYRVVLVPFPFDDLTGSKVRPAVCLTDVVGNYRHVVIAFISSVVPAQLEPSDLILDAPAPLGYGSARIIQRGLGVLTPKLQIEVQNRLCRLFDL